jgi:hypothetical protein
VTTPAPIRVTPDAHDALVYYNFNYSAGTVPNSGSGGVLPLTLTGTLYTGPGQFGDGAALCPAQNGGGTLGGVLYSGDGGTMIGEAATITLSCWFYQVSGTSYASVMALFGKLFGNQDSGPRLCISADGTPTMTVHTGAGNVEVSGAPLALYTWHHIGLTYDGTTLTAYADGVAVGTAMGGALDWGNHGGIHLGGFTHNGTTFISPPAVISDCRWATVVRGADYFTAVWASRRAP